MSRLTNIAGGRRGRSAALLVAAVGGFAAAVLIGVAVANTFTLQTAKNAKVGSTTATIVVNSRGRAVYYLTGDSKSHPECTKTNGCFAFWPPVTVSSAKMLSKAPGITGKLGTWSRNGLIEVTLAGHPLYTYAADRQKDVATGEGIQGFHGTWHVVKASSSGSGSNTTTTTGGGGWG